MPKHREGFSHFLHQRRVALGKQWKTILSDAYLSRATLHRIRHGDPHHPIAEINSLRSLSNALGFSAWSALVAAYDARDAHAGLPLTKANGHAADENGSPTDPVLRLSSALNLTPTELVRRLGIPSPPPDLPTGLQLNLRRPARMVPHFVSGVAASRRVEKLEDEDFESKLPADTLDERAFIVPVDGDCQEPIYNDGENVLFSFDAYEREGILPGKSYYLAFSDGTTTFKRVFLDPADPHVYILRCWNIEKYPDDRRVHFSEVTRIARAVSKQLAPME